MCPSLASKRPVPHAVSSHTVLYDDPSLDKYLFVFCSQPSLLREHDPVILSHGSDHNLSTCSASGRCALRFHLAVANSQAQMEPSGRSDIIPPQQAAVQCSAIFDDRASHTSM